MYYATGLPPIMGASPAAYAGELQMLENQTEALEGQLDQIRKRIEDLESQ